MEDLDPAISFRPATGERQELRDLASARGCTVADLVREAVSTLVSGPPVGPLIAQLESELVAPVHALGHVDDPLAGSATAYQPDDDIDALADRLGGAL